MTGFYDLMLLIDPNAPEERRSAAITEAESLIGSGGNLAGSYDWGQRRMAYEIDHRPEADYRLYQFEGDNALLDRLNQRLRILDGVLRFRIIKAKPGSRSRRRPTTRQSAAATIASRRTPRSPLVPPRTRPRRARHRRRRKASRSPTSRPATPDGASVTASRKKPHSTANSCQTASKRSDSICTLVGQPNQPSLFRSRTGGSRLMAGVNINRVVLTGNLTRDPELRTTSGGTSVCSLRIAVNTRRKDGSTGEWTEKPNYFDVTVWGVQGENCAQYLSKGRPIAVDGRLEWREWQDKEGNKRQSVDIIADSVQFLGSREGGENGGRFTPQSDVPADTADFAQAPVAAGGSDDDIPF